MGITTPFFLRLLARSSGHALAGLVESALGCGVDRHVDDRDPRLGKQPSGDDPLGNGGIAEPIHARWR
ncbi:hypothetical protein SMD20_40080 [Nonomuraea sp. LP-02]|jgi:hypothetical protein|uniref:hypothetical protein n=1 Tax=Nonomuraea TaxID=83681 RepID=UPI0029B5C79D|nr:MULTISPECIES: hypothetical protein [Nonomuraea]MDX3101494.1 hypothetical protein [Nonomuraea angiospora]MED7930480.1 hypothetical protein [Nonomuraea sp. LP-02]WSA53635.1 hypothetical protein OIE67_03070 [Nonomuraea fuscirosea]